MRAAVRPVMSVMRAVAPAPDAEPDISSIFGNFIDHDGELKLDFEEFIEMQPQRSNQLRPTQPVPVS